MPAYFNIVLDTTGPGGVAAIINSGDAATAIQDVSLAVTSTDPDLTGYQVKIWGDVDAATNANIQATEGASSWITLASPHTVRLSAGDGAKTLHVKVRDDVFNESAEVTDSITLDSTVPVVSIPVGPDVSRISTVSGKRTVSFSFQSTEAIQAWKVKVVPATNSIHSAGTQIGSANGSTAVTGGALAATTNQAVTLDGRDVQAASAGDGTKIIKVFVQDLSGNWSA
jgi:hypothetical protein